MKKLYLFRPKIFFMKRITLTICAAAFLLASCKDEKKTEEPIKADATVSSTTDSKPKKNRGYLLTRLQP